jgi:2,3-bisphosphoglycerate-independent phosphoglycerate mutase
MRPEGGSFRIADRVRRELQLHPGFFVINFPAADLTARTGNFDSTIESVQFVDTCLGGVLEYLLGADGTAIITSSHAFGSSAGSQDAMRVPCHFVGPELKGTTIRDDGTLEDVAPTILGLLGIEKPPEMTGTDLRII